MNKVALIIIYNHQYNKNIDVLEKIYKDRFSNIFHLVPFYNGDKQNVIPVYECSHYFQGYISQGFKSFFKEEFSHYFFVADDLILNPIINENNYSSHLNLDSNSCFIPGFITLHEQEKWWSKVKDAYNWRIQINGVEAEHQLPDYDEALQKFELFNLEIKPLRYDQIWETSRPIKSWVKPLSYGNVKKNSALLYKSLKDKLSRTTYSLPYPLVGSYSDILVVNSGAIKSFCHYCGVFAATQLFVEIALPTSLVLSANQICTENDLKLRGRALWTKKDYQELEKYEYSLPKLLTDFPDNYLYLHPIKLSKWQKN
ncbi:hypothetical protein [Salegentibacter chungangensis]|uniref:Glycosyl transferase n=1 Tax=Salegentibacter chungangensis TaxID=1335724 RepID=A0ABW3NQX5_9FLAO